MNIITGGVCAAKGFQANGIHCGIRKNHSKKDLALIYSKVPANAAAVYTTNLVKGAPLLVTRAHIADGRAQAVICNSGNANTCNADGVEIAEAMSDLVAQQLSIPAGDVVVASTGVIGQPLKLDPIAAGLPALAGGLNPDGSAAAAEAIMTTDTVRKEIAVEFELDGKTCHLGGIAKGSLIPAITINEARQLRENGVISGGMIPKVECCIDAIHRGVKNAIIMDGRVPHSILMEILTDEGAGTMVSGGNDND